MLDCSNTLDCLTKLNYDNSFKVFIVSLIVSCEATLTMILGGMDTLSKILLIVIVLEIITSNILDIVKNRYYRKMNIKLIKKMLILFTIGISVLIDMLIKECSSGIGIDIADWASIRTYVILHWICKEGVDTLDNIDNIGSITGKWSSPILLKDIFNKLNKKHK